MTTYKNLFNEFISEDNIRLAIKNASKNKKRKNKRRYEQMVYITEHVDDAVEFFQEYARDFKNSKHTPKTIYDVASGKERTIIVPEIKETIVHHMVINILKPIFLKSMYYHSYGSIPKKGGVKGRKTVEKWIKKDKKNVKYYLQMDIKKFYDNVPHDVLKNKLSRIIKDDEFLKVVFEIIDATELGLPLGFYTSQWFANFYLTELDYYIKQELGAVYFIRYVDDMVIYDSNKRRLHKFRQAIETFLNTKLKLQLKGNYKVCRFDYLQNQKDGECIHRGQLLDFLGYRFYRDKVTLRRRNFYKAVRKARNISKKEKPTIYDCKQMTSYIGWFKYSNTYKAYGDYISPFINMGEMKRYISRRTKYENTIRKLAGVTQCT